MMVGPGIVPLTAKTILSTPSGAAVVLTILNQYSRVTPVSGTSSYQLVEISKSPQQFRASGEFTHRLDNDGEDRPGAAAMSGTNERSERKVLLSPMMSERTMCWSGSGQKTKVVGLRKRKTS